MRLLQQRDQVIWALGNITVSIGLAGLPGAVKAAPSPSAPPIVALEFDDASGKLWKATSRSLAHSHDEGRTWKSVALPAAAQGNIASLTISAGRPKTIYVAVVGSGVLHSHDGGRTWLSRNRGLTNSGVVALAAHATQARTVYAYVFGKGIFRSRDAGASWSFVNHGPSESVVQLAHSRMPGEIGTGWLFAATPKGVRRAMDCFCGWRKAGEVQLNFQVVASDTGWRERVYATAREGFFISQDGGDHWIRMRSPVAPITARASTPSSRLYGAINGKLIRSNDRGVTWEFVAE